MAKRLVCITGASGTMGKATVSEFLRQKGNYHLRVLLRDSRKNRKLAKEWSKHPSPVSVEVVWGDLLDPRAIDRLIKDADVCLHIGGLVSPKADWMPEKTMETNVGAARNIVKAIKDAAQSERTALVYIGSVSQYGPREVPLHWGGAGDPMFPAEFDKYALSKTEAERIVAESGLKRWVCFRQSGILDKTILFKGSDPITFHVPLNGVLEWATVEDSARLMVAVSGEDVPADVWRDFHDIGSGRNFRLTNHEFESLLLKALSCPAPEKVFRPDWFATRNFHGVWYRRSDRLNTLLPFREEITAEDYFKQMASTLPSFFKLARIVPSIFIKLAMKRVASEPRFGTLGWRKTGNSKRLEAHFHPGSAETDWRKAIKPVPSKETNSPAGLNPYWPSDANPTAITPEVAALTAQLRGGRLLTHSHSDGERPMGEQAWYPVEWQCGRGHVFKATPATVVAGGHWCPQCGYNPRHANLEADPMLKTAWLSTHSPEEYQPDKD